MSKARILLILGIWVAILPYLGFPSSWKNILFSLSGLILIYFSYILYRNSKIKERRQKVFDNFSENNNFELNDEKKINQESQEHIKLNQKEVI